MQVKGYHFVPLQSTQIGVFAHLKMEGIVAQTVLAIDATRMDYRTTESMGFHSCRLGGLVCVLYRINYASVTKL